MHQEIDITLNLIFSQPQIREGLGRLDSELKPQLEIENGYLNQEEPIIVEYIETSIQNAFVRLTTSVNAEKCKKEISSHIKNRVKRLLNIGLSSIEVLAIREEAEIYGNV